MMRGMHSTTRRMKSNRQLQWLIASVVVGFTGVGIVREFFIQQEQQALKKYLGPDGKPTVSLRLMREKLIVPGSTTDMILDRMETGDLLLYERKWYKQSLPLACALLFRRLFSGDSVTGDLMDHAGVVIVDSEGEPWLLEPGRALPIPVALRHHISYHESIFFAPRMPRLRAGTEAIATSAALAAGNDVMVMNEEKYVNSSGSIASAAANPIMFVKQREYLSNAANCNEAWRIFTHAFGDNVITRFMHSWFQPPETMPLSVVSSYSSTQSSFLDSPPLTSAEIKRIVDRHGIDPSVRLVLLTMLALDLRPLVQMEDLCGGGAMTTCPSLINLAIQGPRSRQTFPQNAFIQMGHLR